jgi:hypothetical protein
MAGAVAVFGAASGYAQETTIKMGTMAWEDLTPISLITKKFLEQGASRSNSAISPNGGSPMRC